MGETWPHPPPTPSTHTGDEIPTGDVANFVDATSETMIAEINNRISKVRTAPFMGIGFGVLALILFGNGFQAVGVIAAVVTTVATILAAHYDTTRRTTFLHYDLGDHRSEYATRTHICETLAQSAKVWRVNTHQTTSDWKRNAGATSLVGRKEAVIGTGCPPCIETNIEVWGIDAGSTRLYFFPDYLFVLQEGRYGAIPYGTLAAHYSLDCFVENHSVPRDAEIIGHTWQYVRKDGGPDRRFNNNRQLPMARYGVLVLNSSSGLNLYLHCSNHHIAKQAAEQIEQVNPQGAEQQRQEQQRQAERGRADRERAERRAAEQSAEQERQRAKQQREEQERANRHQQAGRKGAYQEGADGQSPTSFDVQCPKCGFSRCMDAKFLGRTLVCPCGKEFLFTEPHSTHQQRTEQQSDREWWEQFRAREQKWKEKWNRPEAEQQGAEQQQQERSRNAAQTKVKTDYEILQVSLDATIEEITAAYRFLAQMYHPDKVENLAPEYKEIGLARMKEINAAFERLKRQHR